MTAPGLQGAPGPTCVPDEAEVEGGHGARQRLRGQPGQRRGQIRRVLARPGGALARGLHVVLGAHLQRDRLQLLRLHGACRGSPVTQKVQEAAGRAVSARTMASLRLFVCMGCACVTAVVDSMHTKKGYQSGNLVGACHGSQFAGHKWNAYKTPSLLLCRACARPIRQRQRAAAAGRACGVLGKQRSSCARGSSPRSQPGAPTRCTVMRSGCGSSRWLHRSSSASTS